jgi:predicted acyltransferase
MEKQQQRVIALDAFRGLTVATMILVNNPGSWGHIYPPLEHASWNGCTPTDLVFPFFLFIVGVSMWFSFKRYDHKLSADSSKKILKRTALIFLVGLLLKAFPFYNMHLETFRIMGVLQRIALAFGVGAFILLGINEKWHKYIGAFILLGYWFALTQWGGIDPYNIATNLVRDIDIAIMGVNHLWSGDGLPFDPEGLFSTFPAIVTVMLGYHTGKIIERNKMEQALNILFVRGLLFILAGMIWNMAMPINKALWTSSYVLYAGGLAMCVLSVALWVIDVKGKKKYITPLLVYGSNALFAFVAAGVFVKTLTVIKIWDGEKSMSVTGWCYKYIYEPIGSAEFSSFLYALTWVILLWLLSHILYKKKIFVKI